MSQPSFESASAPTVLKKKSALNIYTMLLIIALVSLLLGCIFLWLEIREYGGFGAVKGRVGAVSRPISVEALATGSVQLLPADAWYSATRDPSVA